MTVELPKRVAENIGQFTGRTWVLQKLLEWWDRDDDRIFLLTGGPGTGKSMILAWLAGFGPESADASANEKLSRIRKVFKAAHFCQAASRNITSQAFAESIANQLTGTVKGFGDAIAATLAERVSVVGTAQAGTAAAGSSLTGVAIGRIDLGALGDELSFDRAFTQPLKKLYASGYNEPMLLLVDALDEADTYSGVKIPDLLSRLSDLPASIRILATTRDEPRVLKFFRGVKPFDLIKNADSEADDVQAYSEGRLTKLAAGEAVKRRGFAQRLAKESRGVFLYAAMVLDELLEAPPAEFRDLDSYPLPQGLSGLYHEFLNRELGKNEQLWADRYRPLLGLISVAQGEGLTALQLSRIVKHDVDEIGDTLRRCKQYLTGELPDGPFKPFHKSFADFLLEPDEANTDYRISPKTWHDRIADHYLKAFAEDRSNVDGYGFDSLCAHLVAAGRIDELIALIDQPWMQARYEGGGRTYGGFQADLDVSWQAVVARPQPRIDTLVYLRAAVFAVQEQVNVYDNDDLSMLVELGREAEALAHARMRRTAKDRFDALLRIIRTVRAQQRPLAALIADARQAARLIGDSLERVRCFGDLAEALGPSERPVVDEILIDARQSLETMQDADQRAQAQRSLVEALGIANRLQDAERLAMAIDDTLHCAFALKSIAIYVAKAGDFAHAMKLAAGIAADSSTLSRSAIQRIGAEALADIALAQALAKHPSAVTTFAEAERAARQIGEARDRNDALYDLASALTQSGDLAEATRVANSIDNWQRDRVLVDIIDAHASAGAFAMARTLQKGITEANWHSFAIQRRAVWLARSGRYEEARAIARQLTTDADRIHALLTIADALRHSGDSRAEQALAEAVERSATLAGEPRAKAFRHLTRILLQAGDVARAGDAFRRLHPGVLGGQRLWSRDDIDFETVVARDHREYARALRGIATASASVGASHADGLVAAARRSIAAVDPLWRGDERRHLAIGLADVDRFDDAWAVLDSDYTDPERGLAWSALALRLATRDDGRADEAFERALAGVLAIPNDTVRDEELVDLAAALERSQRFDTMEAAAARIRNVPRRCAVLTRLAVCRSEADPVRSRALFHLAEQQARADWSAYSRSEALSHVVVALAECRWFDDAWRVVATIGNGLRRITALAALARHLIQAGDPRGRSLIDEGLLMATRELDDATWLKWFEASKLREEADQLTRDQDAGASDAWSKAKDLAGSPWADWIWREPQYRAKALVGIATAVAREPESDGTFALAHAATMAISHDNPRSETLLELTKQMIGVGRLDLAEQVLADLHREQERRRGIAELVKAYQIAEQPDSALRVARLETSDYYRRDLMREVAVAFARANRMQDALQALEEKTLDGFVGSASMAHVAWADAPPGAVVASMRRLTSVAAWVRPDWRDLHEQLLG